MSIPHIRIYCSENKVDKVRQLTQMICIFNFKDVTDRELDLLCEIIYHGGVNETSKRSFMANYKTSAANYGQVIKRLGDKGILVNRESKDGYTSRTGKLLHPDFELLREHFIEKQDMQMIAILVR